LSIARIRSQLSLKQLFWITLAVLLAVLPQLYRLPLWFFPMTVLVVGYRFYAQVHHLRRAWNALLMFIALAAVTLIIYSQGFGLSREISVTILITMTVLKLLETYRMRDALLVVMLCYFVTMTRFLYSQDLLLIVYLISSAFVTTHALSVLNYEHSNRWFDWRQIRQTVASLSLAIPFAVLFFLVFPRLGSPIWGSPDIFGEGKTGISDTMSPGSIVELFMDDSPAFRVTFDDNRIPENQNLYWRGPVLWHFDGRTWSRQRHRNLRPAISSFNQQDVVNYQVELEATGQNYMFALDYVLNGPSTAFMLPDSMLYSPTKINQLKHYESSSLLMRRLYAQLSATDRALLLDYPREQNQRTQALIRQWQAEDSNTEAIINRALRWFNQDDFYYSYTPPALYGEVIDQFLFDSKRGFCEHYASSFTIMMRMAGIPARVVTGYQGGIDNGGYLLVKQSDAHAWSEVFIEQQNGRGYWLRVDPTSVVAPERVEQGARQIMDQKRNFFDYQWLISLQERLDKYRFSWNQWVRDYNSSKQEALFRSIGIEHRDGRSLALMLGGILLATGLLTLIPVWWLRRRKYHSLQRLYLRFCRLFRNNRTLWQQRFAGLEPLAEQIIIQYPQAEAQVRQFVKLYLHARYSEQDNRQRLLKPLHDQLSRVRQAIQPDT
jgi:transglutaminase-like putative cysteine protease